MDMMLFQFYYLKHNMIQLTRQEYFLSENQKKMWTSSQVNMSPIS